MHVIFSTPSKTILTQSPSQPPPLHHPPRHLYIIVGGCVLSPAPFPLRSRALVPRAGLAWLSLRRGGKGRLFQCTATPGPRRNSSIACPQEWWVHRTPPPAAESHSGCKCRIQRGYKQGCVLRGGPGSREWFANSCEVLARLRFLKVCQHPLRSHAFTYTIETYHYKL